MDDYADFDALGLADLVRQRKVSAGELLDAALNRTRAVNPALNAVINLRDERARAEINAGLPNGPFAGVPFLLKDLHAGLAGEPLTNGSQFWKDNVPDHDSELVARYKRAGLVIFGRSTSPELGLTPTTESSLWGDTHNPWLRGYSAGGSSGGAAAAVAAGILPVAHASDGGGSIRIPASCCGVFGLKPTRGRIPAGPDTGEGWGGMSAQHVVSRTVRDSAAMLDATAGPDVGAPYFAPPPARPFLDEVGAPTGRLRIALQRHSWSGVRSHPDCVAAVESAAALCRELGHEVIEEDIDVDAQASRGAGVIIGANIHATVNDRANELGRPPEPIELSAGTFRMYELGQSLMSEEYVRAIRGIHALGRQVGRFFERFDVLLTPTMATPPLPHGRLSLDREDVPGYVEDIGAAVAFTSLFNAAGNPSMSVPLHWNALGLPIGVQFTAAYCR